MTQATSFSLTGRSNLRVRSSKCFLASLPWLLTFNHSAQPLPQRSAGLEFPSIQASIMRDSSQPQKSHHCVWLIGKPPELPIASFGAAPALPFVSQASSIGTGCILLSKTFPPHVCVVSRACNPAYPALGLPCFQRVISSVSAQPQPLGEQVVSLQI